VQRRVDDPDPGQRAGAFVRDPAGWFELSREKVIA
jgi:hypothetical protein